MLALLAEFTLVRFTDGMELAQAALHKLIAAPAHLTG
jgi:hypothetical protein